MTAQAQVFPIVIEQGAPWDIDVVYKVNGVAKDITGYSVGCYFKDKAKGVVIARPTCTITDPLLGKAHIGLTGEETWLIPAPGTSYDRVTQYVYDVYLYDPTGVAVCRLLNGIVTVSPGVSQPEVVAL